MADSVLIFAVILKSYNIYTSWCMQYVMQSFTPMSKIMYSWTCDPRHENCYFTQSGIYVCLLIKSTSQRYSGQHQRQ